MSAGHASESLIGRYAAGDTAIGPDEVWALEAHLEACAVCRAHLSAAVGERAPEILVLTDGVWSGLGPLLDRCPPVPARRWWRRRPWPWAVPAMVPWTVMTLLVTLLAVLLDLSSPSSFGGVSWVQLIAPVLPVPGVAVSWARGLDPLYELTTATPRAGPALVLRRTLAVLVVVVPALLVAGAVTGTTVALWLLPCLAFTAAALALGGLVGVVRAAVALLALWAAAVVAPAVGWSRASVALRPDDLPVWGALLVLAATVVVVRASAYSLLGARR